MNRAGRPVRGGRGAGHPPGRAARSRPVFSSAAWLPPVLAVVLVVLAGGLLLRGGGPALWAARWRAAARCPTGSAAVGRRRSSRSASCSCVARACSPPCYAPATPVAGVLPTPTSLADLAAVLADGAAELQEQATPGPAADRPARAHRPLFVGLVAVVVDLVAVAGRQAAVAGLGLLVLYCVPVGTITGGIGLIAARRAGRRPRPAAVDRPAPPAGRRGRGRAHRRARPGTGTMAALRIGAAALVAGLVVGAVVPTLAEGSLATGLGGGVGRRHRHVAGPGRRAAAASSPCPSRSTCSGWTPSVDDPGYLRAVTLDQYDTEDGWTMSNLDGEDLDRRRRPARPAPDRPAGPPGDRRRSRCSSTTTGSCRCPFSPLSVRMHDDERRGLALRPGHRDRSSAATSPRAGQSYTVDGDASRAPRPTLLRGAEQLPPERRRPAALHRACRRWTRGSPTSSPRSTGDAPAPYERVRAHPRPT